jgi:F0F1-type ATP synthase membrane subunit b/b'
VSSFLDLFIDSIQWDITAKAKMLRELKDIKRGREEVDELRAQVKMYAERERLRLEEEIKKPLAPESDVPKIVEDKINSRQVQELIDFSNDRRPIWGTW